jgi:hypothetical protein
MLARCEVANGTPFARQATPQFAAKCRFSALSRSISACGTPNLAMQESKVQGVPSDNDHFVKNRRGQFFQNTLLP